MRRIVAVAMAVAIATMACSLFASHEVDAPLGPAERSARIENLRQAIATDHASLESLIVESPHDVEIELHENPEVRAIADRLGAHERELARLVLLEREDGR
jgi:hypothetical protein